MSLCISISCSLSLSFSRTSGAYVYFIYIFCQWNFSLCSFQHGGLKSVDFYSLCLRLNRFFVIVWSFFFLSSVHFRWIVLLLNEWLAWNRYSFACMYARHCHQLISWRTQLKHIGLHFVTIFTFFFLLLLFCVCLFFHNKNSSRWQ